MAILDILCSDPLNLKKWNQEDRTQENFLLPIKNIETYFMAH